MTSRTGRSIVACLALLCAKCGSPSNDTSLGNGGEPGDAQGVPAVLGEACDTDQECPEGATCLREGGDNLFGGGPPRGLCAAECTGATEECERFANAVCVSTSEDSASSKAYCFPACAPGVEQLDKCGERTDLACERLPSSPDAGFCRPLCTDDDECTEGFCDRRQGVCSTSASRGLDLGQPCSPDSEEPECAGTCLDLGGGYAVCSHRCAYGSAGACTASSEAPGYCLFAASGGSLGDLGYCAQVCDCNDECSHPGGACDPFTTAAVRDLLDASGVCAPIEDAAEGLACTG